MLKLATCPHVCPYVVATTEIVLPVPNLLHEPIQNAVGGAIVLAFRGATTLLQKAQHAQTAGAIALLIMDDGQCSMELNCGRLGSAAEGASLAQGDGAANWRHIFIPVGMVSQDTGFRILRLMNTTAIHAGAWGRQLVTVQARVQPAKLPTSLLDDDDDRLY